MTSNWLLLILKQHGFPKPLSGNPFSLIQMSSGWYLWTSSGNVSFQESTVSPPTSPDSPHATFSLMLYCFYHPFKVLSSGLSITSAICFAFAINWLPSGNTFLEQATSYHLYKASLIWPYWDGHLLRCFKSHEAFSSRYNAMIWFFFFSIWAIWVFLHLKSRASFLMLTFGFLVGTWTTSYVCVRLKLFLLLFNIFTSWHALSTGTLHVVTCSKLYDVSRNKILHKTISSHKDIWTPVTNDEMWRK